MTTEIQAQFSNLIHIMQLNAAFSTIVFMSLFKRAQVQPYKNVLKITLFVFLAISIYFFYFIFSNHLVKF